jgi:hypothetical protein
MQTIYEKLRDAWIAGGFAVNSGADAPSIPRFEQKRSLRLPRSFKDYLLTVNGMSDGLTDEDMISFHSLECIDRNWGRYPHGTADFVETVFADYLLDSHWYVLRSNEFGSDLGVWVADDPENCKKLAGSFDDFIVSYLSNPAQVAYCW